LAVAVRAALSADGAALAAGRAALLLLRWQLHLA
jgi:hypothetical protein